jgi:protein-tyrosine-phosphatase
VAAELSLDLELASAGIAAHPGIAASDGSLRAARRHGLDLDEHRARLLTPELVEGSDLVLAMSAGHLARVEAFGGAEKGWIITEFAQVEGLTGGVPDPFGGDDEIYEEAYRALESLVAGSLQRLLPRPAR